MPDRVVENCERPYPVRLTGMKYSGSQQHRTPASIKPSCIWSMQRYCPAEEDDYRISSPALLSLHLGANNLSPGKPSPSSIYWPSEPSDPEDPFVSTSCTSQSVHLPSNLGEPCGNLVAPICVSKPVSVPLVGSRHLFSHRHCLNTWNLTCRPN